MSKFYPISIILSAMAALIAFYFDLPAQPTTKGRDEFLYARKLYDEGYYDIAAEQFERCLRDFPTLPESDEAQFLLGESYFAIDKLEPAREAYLKTAVVYPNSPRAPEALFKVGATLHALGRTLESAQAYERVQGFYPGDMRAPVSLYNAALQFKAAGRSMNSEAAVDKLIEKYPDSEAADAARLMKAELYKSRGESGTAAKFYQRVASESAVDSLAAVALLEWGILLRANWEFDRAAESFEGAIERLPNSEPAAEARLELADLLNYRLSTAAALELVGALIESKNPLLSARSKISAGDSYYRRGEFELALSYYDAAEKTIQNAQSPDRTVIPAKAGIQSERDRSVASTGTMMSAVKSMAIMKGAWTAEKLRRIEDAEIRYGRLFDAGGRFAARARVRAAILAGQSGQWKKSAKHWTAAIRDRKAWSVDATLLSRNEESDRRANDGTGTVIPAKAGIQTDFDIGSMWYKTAEARYMAGIDGVASAVDSLTAFAPTHPFADEAMYLGFKEAVQTELKASVPSLPQPLEYFDGLPASPLADSAARYVDYIRRQVMHAPGLIQKMAELSSRSPHLTNPLRWSLDWGDFYLFDFKDAVKAIDKYSDVFSTPGASDADRKYATLRSGQAFLRLHEAALWEGDDYALRMYADSALAIYKRLNDMRAGVDEMMSIGEELMRLRLSAAGVSQSENEFILSFCRGVIAEFGAQNLKRSTLSAYLQRELEWGVADPDSISGLLEIARQALVTAGDRRDAARLELFIVTALEVIGESQAAAAAAESIVQVYPDTPSAAEACWMLINNGTQSPQRRFELYQDYIDNWGYLTVPGVTDTVAAALLDSLGRPLEALHLRLKAETDLAFGMPRLNILESPHPAARFSRAHAHLGAGDLKLAEQEFRIIIRSDVRSRWDVPAMLALANIYRALQDYRAALVYTLRIEKEAPGTKEALAAARLTPVLLMEQEDYADAREAWLKLARLETDEDAVFESSVMAVVCLYRLDKLDQARDEANLLYRSFKERTDLEELKARFYLERGRSHDRGKLHAEARRQYQIVRDKYSFSAWAEDASFRIGLSLISDGKQEEGAAALERFVENYPHSRFAPDAYLQLGLSWYRASKFSEAIRALKMVWASKENVSAWPTAFSALMNIYRDLRFWDAAIRMTRDYLDRFPDPPDAIDRRMDIGQFYLAMGEWDEAVRQYKPLLPFADAEREAEIQYYIGEAYQSKGDYQTAILEYLKVKILGRKTKLDWGVTAIYQCAVCYENLSDYEGAVRMYRRIIQETGETSNYGRSAMKRLEALEQKAGR